MCYLNDCILLLVLQQYSELSMDSGRGTMATVLSGRSAISTRGKPFPAFPIRDLHSQISEDDERVLNSQWYTGSDPGSYTGHGSTSSQQRHPPSPPVRLRDRYINCFIYIDNVTENRNNLILRVWTGRFKERSFQM